LANPPFRPALLSAAISPLTVAEDSFQQSSFHVEMANA